MNVEEGVSIRAVQRVFANVLGITFDKAPTPKEIYEIGMGSREGYKQAAVTAYHRMAVVLGDAIANVLTVIDGIAVIGGGVAGAYPLFLDKVIEEMNSTYRNSNGDVYGRLSPRAFNLENEDELKQFIAGDSKEITIPGSTKKLKYDPLSRVGVGISKLGTSEAVAIGAYAFALNQIDTY